MHSFQDLDLKTLKKICSKYNLHVKIAKYSKLSKEELIPHMEKHLHINDQGKIKLREAKYDSINAELSKIIEELKFKVKEVKEKVKKQQAKKPMMKEEPKEEKNINIESKKVIKEMDKVKKDEKKEQVKAVEQMKENLGVKPKKEKKVMPKKETPKEKKYKKETPKEDETPVNFDDLVKEYIKLYENKSDNVKLNKYAKAIKARSSYGFDNRGLLSQIYNFYKKKETPKEDDEKYRQHGKEQVKNLSKKYKISEEEVMKILSMIDKDNMEKGNVQPLTEVEFEYYLNKKDEEDEEELPEGKIKVPIKKQIESLENYIKIYENLIGEQERKLKRARAEHAKEKINSTINHYKNIEIKNRQEKIKELQKKMPKESIVEKVDNLENELKKLEQLMKIDEKENEQEHKELKKEIKSEKKEIKSEKKEFTVKPLTGSKAEMTKQYKKQALKFHPDKNIGHEEEAKKAFQILTAEYEKKMGDDAKEVVDEEEDKFNDKASFVNIKIMSFIKKYDTAEKRKEKLNGYMEYIKKNKKYTAQEKKDLLKKVEMFKKDEDYLKFIGSQSTKKLSMDELNKALNEWYQLKFIGNSKRDILEWCKKYNVCENKSYAEIQKTFKL